MAEIDPNLVITAIIAFLTCLTVLFGKRQKSAKNERDSWIGTALKSEKEALEHKKTADEVIDIIREIKYQIDDKNGKKLKLVELREIVDKTVKLATDTLENKGIEF